MNLIVVLLIIGGIMVVIKTLITTSTQKNKFNQFDEKVNFIRSKFSYLKNSNIDEKLDKTILLSLKKNDITSGKITSYDIYTPNIKKSGGNWEVRVSTYLYGLRRENIIVFSVTDKELELSKDYKDFIKKDSS
tara:strand:+ start:1471 stop:1869 length:399 start_codon:yes stop_codon:yes gene_type:complete